MSRTWKMANRIFSVPSLRLSIAAYWAGHKNNLFMPKPY